MALFIEVVEREDRTVLVLRGELDLATAPKLRDALREVIGEGQTVVVDLESVTFLDSSGLGILVSARKRAMASSGNLELVCTNRAVLRVFQISELDQAFTFRTGD